MMLLIFKKVSLAEWKLESWKRNAHDFQWSWTVKRIEKGENNGRKRTDGELKIEERRVRGREKNTARENTKKRNKEREESIEYDLYANSRVLLVYFTIWKQETHLHISHEI